MSTRTFTHSSTLDDSGLALALSDALTPSGLVANPTFFSGFATHPQVFARGLIVLADITATRYFNYTPVSQRDPVLSAQGDRMRAEVFSACNGVYARLDLLADGFDGGDITHGTTNVDIGPGTRVALGSVRADHLLHLAVGSEGLTVSDLDATHTERPVQMPDRWVRALGNVAQIHHELQPRLTLDAAETRAFLATVPSATGTGRNGWLTPIPGRGVRVSARPSKDAVYINGLHRLSAAKRLLPHLLGMRAYGTEPGEPGHAVVQFDIPGARLTLGLTEESWRGYSGEGALLESLAEPSAIEDADLISALLAFDPIIDVPRLSKEAALTPGAVTDALAVLAVSGRVGWDNQDGAYFHRELPDDDQRVTKDNPRLVGARQLIQAGAVTPSGDGSYLVSSTGSSGVTEYTVRQNPDRCTCPWYLKHADSRGPCKHILAVQIFRR